MRAQIRHLLGPHETGLALGGGQGYPDAAPKATLIHF